MIESIYSTLKDYRTHRDASDGVSHLTPMTTQLKQLSCKTIVTSCLPADVRGRRSCPFSTAEPRLRSFKRTQGVVEPHRRLFSLFGGQLLCLPPPVGLDASVFFFFTTTLFNLPFNLLDSFVFTQTTSVYYSNSTNMVQIFYVEI